MKYVFHPEALTEYTEAVQYYAKQRVEVAQAFIDAVEDAIYRSRAEVEQMLGITLQQTRVYQEAKEEGREEGQQQATVKLVIRQLTKRFGELSEEMRSSISSLPLPILENLSEALLDFTNLVDLQVWLEAQG